MRIPIVFSQSVALAARSALQLYRPTSRTRTHLMQIEFRYEPDHLEWADRFLFQSIKVVTYAQAGSEYACAKEHAGELLWQRQLEEAQAEVDARAREHIASDLFYIAFIVGFTVNGRETSASMRTTFPFQSQMAKTKH